MLKKFPAAPAGGFNFHSALVSYLQPSLSASVDKFLGGCSFLALRIHRCECEAKRYLTRVVPESLWSLMPLMF